MNQLSLLEKAINEHGSASILRDRLDLVKEKQKALEEMNQQLADEITRLKKENQELRNQVQELDIPKEFVEARGVLFRRLEKGGFEPDPYCPDCKKPMMSLANEIPYKCSKCKFMASFNGRQVTPIIKSIDG